MMNEKSFVCLFGVLLSARITLQASSPASSYYVGAAVEYYPVTKGENGTIIANENAKNYVKFLKKASEHEVDIIVFPEGSLTAGRSFPAEERTRYFPHSSYVPDPKDRVTPCKNDSSPVMQALKAISCAAKQYATYIVVNIREKAKCNTEKATNCSKDGYDLYNTNVVFDRQGVVVARYRKYNLFGEPGFNKTLEPELSTFRTDFDVTFGQFICFDIIFENPALSLIRDSKITDVVFSSQWFSELPFLTSSEIQSSWSYANNVNFLASGYNDPSRGSGGSGLYAGTEGSLTILWPEKRANALLVAKIPKIVNGRRNQRAEPLDSMTYLFPKNEIPTIDGAEPVSQQKLKLDDLSPYTSNIFTSTNGTQSLTLCDRGLCCEFMTDTIHHNVGQNNVKYYRYRFVVFKGVRSYSEKGTGGVEICGIISCIDDTLESCNQRFDNNDIIVHPVTFNGLVIAGNFTVGTSIMRLPIGINTDLQPLNASDFTFMTSNLNQTHANLKYSLKKAPKGLMTFAIWGRDFSLDGTPKTVQSSANQASPFLFMLVMLVILGIGSTHAIGSLPNVA